MSRLHRLVFPTLILTLVALAAFGIRQVIVGQEDQTRPILPEEAAAIRAAAEVRSHQAVADFVATGQDPCSLPRLESSTDVDTPYQDLPSLVNDADVIVMGRPSANIAQEPAAADTASAMLTTLEVDEGIAGHASAGSITLYSGQSVVGSPDGVARSGLTGGPDFCTPGQVLLFLKATEDPNVYSYALQGWARIEGQNVQAFTIENVFADYRTPEALLAAVRLAADEQGGTPNGRLLCESKRTSEDYQDPIVCPGDTFNPYEAFRFDTVASARISRSVSGPSTAAVTRSELTPDDPTLGAILVALDAELTLAPDEPRPADLVSLFIYPARPVNRRDNFLLEYSPGTGIVQMPHSGGQFPAPPAFVEAMKPFLAPTTQ